MRGLAVVFVVLWAIGVLFFMSSSGDGMKVCQEKYSYDTCFQMLNR